MGRTGKLFAHEWSGIAPDVMAAAKGIAGGVPMGAILAREAFAKHFAAGTHGSTFGGNPLASAAANAVLDVILAPGFLAEVERKGRELHAELEAIRRDFPDLFEEVRGFGLILGLKCRVPQADVQQACLAEGLLVLTAAENVVRLTPPLVITDADIAEAVAMLRRGAARCMSAAEAAAAQ